MQFTPVERVMGDQPAERPVSAGNRLRGRTTGAVVAVDLMVDEVIDGVGVEG
jgi:hypothetical protein